MEEREKSHKIDGNHSVLYKEHCYSVSENVFAMINTMDTATWELLIELGEEVELVY